MHKAPAVQYTVGKTRVHLGLVLSVALFSAVVVSVWAMQSQTGTLPLTLVGLVWTACTLWGSLGWWRVPTGQLCWDGQAWVWRQGAQELTLQLQVRLDLQHTMLLRARPVQGLALWLWLEQATQPAQWRMLRRAVVVASNQRTVSGRQQEPA